MTFFGVIWIVLIIRNMCKANIRPMMELTLVGMIWQCNNVFSFGGISCGPQLITSAFFILKSFFATKSMSLRKMPAFALPWLFFLVYIPLNAFVIHSEISLGEVLNVLQIIVYIVAFIQFYRMSMYTDAQFVDQCVKVLIRILVSVGAIQLLIELLKLPKNTIFATLVYNDTSNTNICYYNKNVFRLYSTFMEPSYCAAIMVGLLFYVVFRKKIYNAKTRYWVIGILILCIILTQSSTAYGTLAIMATLYVFLYIDNVKTWMALGLGCIVVLYLLFGTNLLNTVVLDKFSSGSGTVRANMNSRAWRTFLTSRVTGVGYGNGRGSSIVYTLLAELGLIGFASYTVFLFQMLIQMIHRRKSIHTVMLGATYMAVAGLLSQIIACPDLDLSSFWLTMYFFALGVGIVRVSAVRGPVWARRGKCL